MKRILRVYSFEWKDLRKREKIDLSEFEGQVYVIFFNEFRGDSRVNLRVNFVEVCVQFD